MTNHFHLLVEDPRGMLSRMMLRLQSAYARFFLDARGRRGSGHLFGDRFHCEVVDSARYYDELSSYILLNPLRCRRPLAPHAAAYRWSSAALHLSDRPAADFFRTLLDEVGPLEALLAAMPKLSRRECERRRLARFEALLGAEWIAPELARCGRTPDQMRLVLAERAGMPRPASDSAPDAAARVEPTPNQVRRAVNDVPRASEPFHGRGVGAVAEAVREACPAFVPADHPASAEVACYALWRFSSASVRRIAAALGTAADAVARSVARVRVLLRSEPAWASLLWRLEWRLRWRLGAAGWRA